MAGSKTVGGTETAAVRIDALLDHAAAFFAESLWSGPAGSAALASMTQDGLDPDLLRSFGVGYAPGDHRALLAALREHGYADEEVLASGVATRSARGRIAVQLVSRIVFPIRDDHGRSLGFAGLATNPGPSWSEWVTSAETERFRRSAALFGLDLAAPSISRERQARVFRDCRDVVRNHGQGDHACVAVIRSSLGQGHLAQLARHMGVGYEELESVKDAGAVVVKPRTGAPDRASDRRDRRDVETARSRGSDSIKVASAIRPDQRRELTRGERIAINCARVIVGAAVPIGWIVAVGPREGEPGGPGSAFVGAVGGVAVTYLLLAIAAAAISGLYQARSRARRMRAPWARGATEWQPPAWTYNLAEDVLVAAALISMVVCVVLFVTVGGFT